jgi:hypothetical protein
MRSKTPTVSYGDAHSPGQLAQRWEKPSHFVRSLVDDGNLSVDDRGLVTNTELHRFYREGGQALLDA